MILTVEQLRRFMDTDESDEVLEAKLAALEVAIKGHTNNNFNRVLEQNGGEWPMDIKMGVVNLMKWDASNREKAGVASETISRHSVTYETMTQENSSMGYPRILTGFLRPYMKARFGQGVRL